MTIPNLPALDTWQPVANSIPTTALYPPCIVANPSGQYAPDGIFRGGWLGLEGKIEPWVSPAWDESREEWNFLICGGHGDNHGNYSIKWRASTAAWVRMDDATHGPHNESPIYFYPDSDGWYPSTVGGAAAIDFTGWTDVPKPTSRHTYDTVDWLPNIDRGLVMGGIPADGGGGSGDPLWPALWNPTTATWFKDTGPGVINTHGYRHVGSAVYDPVTGNVLVRLCKTVGIYNPTAHTWQELGLSSYFNNGWYQTTIYCPRDDAFWTFGDYNTGTGTGDLPDNGFALRTMTRPSYQEQVVTAIAGDTSLLRDAADNVWRAGRCWHAGLGKFAFWYGGADIHLLDPITRSVTVQTLGGTPPAPRAVLGAAGPAYPGFYNGLYRRMVYSPSNDVIMLMIGASTPMYYARLSGSLIPPTTTTTTTLPPPSGPGTFVFASMTAVFGP